MNTRDLSAAGCIILGGLLGTAAAFVPHKAGRWVRTFAAVCALALCLYCPALYCFARVSHLPFSWEALFPDAASLLVGVYLYLLAALAVGFLLGCFRAGGARPYWSRALRSRWHQGLMFVFTAVNLFFPLAGAGFSGAVQTKAPTLRITEICPHNFNLRSLDGDCADYIELYNYGAAPVDLCGFFLSDNQREPGKCSLPELLVQPGEYVLVWANGSEPEVVGVNEVTANFRLSGGEQVLLSVNGRMAVDTVDIPDMAANVAFTLMDDGAWAPAYGTPGISNSQAVPYVPVTAEEPRFSVPGGFYDGPVTVELSGPEGCCIYYTLDSSTPDEGSIPYLGPITLKDTGKQPNRFVNAVNATVTRTSASKYDAPVDKGTVLRAVAVDADGSYSPVISASYFIGDFSAYEGMAVLSIVSDPEDLFGEDGICVTGTEYDAWSDSGGAQEDQPTPNFRQQGKVWERPAAIQLWNPSGSLALDDRCGIRLQGNSSRGYQKKRFALFAREFYSGSSVFSSPIWGHCKTHSVFLRYDEYDFMAQTLVSDRDLGCLGTMPVSVFLDGEFYYTAYMLERYDSEYFTAHFGVEPDDLILLSDSEVDIGFSGDEKLFRELVGYIQANDASDPAVYREIERQMDVQSYIDFVCANIYCNNLDWSFYKNFKVWRTRSTGGQGYQDGRWRWLVYDMDAVGWATDLVGQPSAEIDVFHCTQPYVPLEVPRPQYIDMPIFSDLLKNPDFKKQFVLTYLDMMNVNFDYERVMPILEQYGLEGNSRWTVFLHDRPEYAVKYLTEALELPGRPCTLTLDVQCPQGGSVTVNTTVPDTSSGAWSGTYLSGVPVSLIAKPQPGWEFAGWRGIGTGGPELTLTLDGDITVTAIFAPAGAAGGKEAAYAD